MPVKLRTLKNRLLMLPPRNDHVASPTRDANWLGFPSIHSLHQNVHQIGTGQDGTNANDKDATVQQTAGCGVTDRVRSPPSKWISGGSDDKATQKRNGQLDSTLHLLRFASTKIIILGHGEMHLSRQLQENHRQHREQTNLPVRLVGLPIPRCTPEQGRHPAQEWKKQRRIQRRPRHLQRHAERQRELLARQHWSM